MLHVAREALLGQLRSVKTPAGFKEAYRTYVEGGWTGLSIDPQWGGQGLPTLVSTAVLEMWKSSNLAFSLCQMLTLGAVEAIAHHGSDALKRRFLEPMVAGRWTGTMNLTEPQAGSDLAALRSRAVPEGDHYRVSGNKIFITWGEHDMAENIVHLVLARLPDAPPGVKGISLFLCPKYLVNDDGSLGERNDLACTSIEHKMGIHGSPTASMSFGDCGGAIGYLVGEPNRGLEYMFIMMNAARYGVGLQGVAIADRAYQKAVAYAKDRVQSRPVDGSVAGSAASVVSTTSIVARPGASIPAPLAIPPTLQPSGLVCAACLGTVSVVMIARAARSPAASKQKRSPWQTSACSRSGPSSSSAEPGRSSRSTMEALPYLESVRTPAWAPV